MIVENRKETPLSTIIKRRSRDTVILPKKEYEGLKKAAEEIDTLRAILIFEEERRGGKLKSFRNARDLIRDLDH